MRGQANFLALVAALLVVTTVVVLSMAVVDGAFRSAERDAVERATAEIVADRLVAADSQLTDRRNVLDASRLDEEYVSESVPSDADVRITVAGKPVYERGRPTDGSTVRRFVLVAERQTITVDPPPTSDSVTLPRRSPRATVTVDGDADVETVLVNDRVVLHDPDGIDGEYDVELSRYETATLEFEDVTDTPVAGESPEHAQATDGYETGDVTVTYYPRQTADALLEVTVDA